MSTQSNEKQNFAHLWKREILLVEFPSGAKAEMTKPNTLSIMTKSDQISDSFFELIIDSQQAGVNPLAKLKASEMKDFLVAVGHIAEQLALVNFVNPRVVESPDYDAGEISPEDVRNMDMVDKQFLMQWGFNGGDPAVFLTRFRSGNNTVIAEQANS